MAGPGSVTEACSGIMAEAVAGHFRYLLAQIIGLHVGAAQQVWPGARNLPTARPPPRLTLTTRARTRRQAAGHRWRNHEYHGRFDH
jgi:hypothetical protein